MGEYNPHAPVILGQEYVGIRDEDITFLPGANTFEVGSAFTLKTSRRIRDARFYINEIPAVNIQNQARTVNIYPAGREAETGPIKEVTIPATSGGMTGASFTIVGSTSVAGALWRPGDNSYLNAVYTGGLQELNVFFGVNSYPELAGKRILNVSLVTQGAVYYTKDGEDLPYQDPFPATATTTVQIINNTGTQTRSYRGNYSSPSGALGLNTIPNPNSGSAIDGAELSYLNFGDVTPFISTSGTINASSTTYLPWRYVDLQRFEAGASNRLQVYVIIQISDPADVDADSGTLQLEYMALRVLYCEEQRVSYGGTIAKFIQGTNIVPMYDTNNTTDPVLPAGNYTATLAWVDPGDISFTTNTQANFPKVNGLRELYTLPTHPGVQVNVPFPAEDRIGDIFTKEHVHVIPQMSLHTSGSGPLTEFPVYGRQAKAEVYGSVTATQEILDSAAGGTGTYPWVRYYARRFGNTTVPLRLDNPSVTGAGTYVELTPAEWDELDEIVDGWKEVTLRFVTAPTMGTGTNPQFRWSAAGENIGNRWEVLGLTAPALSGNPGNLKLLVPSPNQLSNATYGAPSAGSTINMGWVPQYSPAITATADDQTTDAVILFAQDMPTVTGFTVILSSQALSGIGQDCGIDPCCIPSEMFFNQLEWSLPFDADVVTDSFNRTEAAGSWGNADTGQAWAETTAANFSVADEQGLISNSGSGSPQTGAIDIGSPDFDVTVRAGITTAIAGTSADVGLIGRYTDASNYYYFKLRHTAAGVTNAYLGRRVAASDTDILTLPAIQAGGSGTMLNLRFVGYGQFLRGKVWPINEPEPDLWTVEATDTTIVNGDSAGVFAVSTGAATNVFAFEAFAATPPGYWFGKYELQRMDTVDNEWQTIMAATNPGQSSFKDFEARIGIESTYRIRMVNVYDFPGPWSSEVSETITEPGVEIGCEGGHLLVFSSNERQDGGSNLAYSSVWEGQVAEDFVFPEADFTQLQAMYGRNFFTAFRPSERGGERFGRTVLVQAAAIAPETLGDFTGLRDMAWADTPYVCVRDEDGNRWFATILVPGGRVQLYRRLYMAPVEVIEVTATPSEVDP